MRFLGVGVLNTIFGFGCYAILVLLGLHYTLAIALSTICGVIFNFKTLSTIVFHASGNRRIFRFILAYIIIYFFNAFGVYFIGMCGGGLLLGGAIMLLPAAFLAYILQKLYVFKM
jgi:putative flippase GtrA